MARRPLRFQGAVFGVDVLIAFDTDKINADGFQLFFDLIILTGDQNLMVKTMPLWWSRPKPQNP